jgi:peptide/nickel transport system permease protein
MSTLDQPRGIAIPLQAPPVPQEKPGEVQDVAPAYEAQGVWRLAFNVFIQHRLAVIGLGIVVFMTLFCFIGPLIYHTDQTTVNLNNAELAPRAGHLLGTDEYGFDVIGRLMVGGQTSLEIGIAAAMVATVFGVLWGAVAGFFGGWIDALLMRFVDVMLAIPSLFLLLFLAVAFPRTVPILILVVAITAWLIPARLVRAEALTLRTRDYVQAVTMMGGGGFRIVLRHIIPNSIGTIMVNATFQVADAILLVAAINFLGLGIAPPATNWGAMLSGGVDFVYDGWWWLIYPAGIAIVLTVVAFNFIGDALRDALEVRLQKR